MRRALLLTLSVAFLLGLYAHSAPAAHAEDYSWDDPIVMIDGHVVQILIGVAGKPDEIRRKVQAANVTIMVPAGTDTRVLKVTSVYFRENVKFVSVGGQSSSGGWDDRGNGGNNGNGWGNNNGNGNGNNNNGSNGNGNNNGSGNNNGNGNGNGGNGRGNGNGNGNNGDNNNNSSRSRNPISVTVVVTFEATATLPAATKIFHPGGIDHDEGTTSGRLSETFVLR